MSKVWSDLPNAKYIDMILGELKVNPKGWDTQLRITGSAGWNVAWNTVGDASRHNTRRAANTTVWNATMLAGWPSGRGNRSGAWDAARGAILALAAYDDCAYLLDEKPEHVRFLSLLGDNTAATLMYPACVALRREMA